MGSFIEKGLGPVGRDEAVSAPSRRLAAFTMIELLVVIAIIALLAAIIFPVFATVRENGRQTGSMSNMHDISTKMEQYKLDTQHYPEVLFGYAKPGVNMDKILDSCTASGDCPTYLVGLYPEYVHSWTEFQDPNNNVKLSDTKTPPELHLCSPSDTETACGGSLNGGALVLSSTPKPVYTADAYDLSPLVATSNSVDTTNYIMRYQTSWTSIDGTNLDCGISGSNTFAITENMCKSPNTGDLVNMYLNQLRWRNPPSNTYVTATTYHVQQASVVLVLMQDGSVHKIDAAKFQKLDGQITLDGSGVVVPKFWQVTL